MKTYSAFLLVLLSAGCIEFRSDVDVDRHINILAVSPQPNQSTGIRHKFSVMLSDSYNRPGQLKVFGKVDGGKKRTCTYDPDPTNTIDETRQEIIFRCPIDGSVLESGEHSVRYWVVDRNDETRAERSVGFVHDGDAPVLSVDSGDLAGEVELSWSIGDAHDFAELGVYANGVRVFSSGTASGTAILDTRAFGNQSELEVRAIDKVKNVSSQVVAVR